MIVKIIIRTTRKAMHLIIAINRGNKLEKKILKLKLLIHKNFLQTNHSKKSEEVAEKVKKIKRLDIVDLDLILRVLQIITKKFNIKDQFRKNFQIKENK